jgi:hypothetical protein
MGGGGIMKYVEFYDGTSGAYVKTGEVRLINGELEITPESLRGFLENNAVYLSGPDGTDVLYPSDADKEKYLNALPQAFCGSMFRASLVQEK